MVLVDPFKLSSNLVEIHEEIKNLAKWENIE